MALKKKAKKEEVQIDEKDVEAMLAKGKLIMDKLEAVYPQAPRGFLTHSDPFTLLIAVVLSAQSLDVKVNEITPKLFRLADTPDKMRALGEERIREIIKQIGLAPQKAKNISKLSATICDEYGGQVPDTFEELERLNGVGHKTASVVMMQAFNKPAFPVDTHIHRLACRWGCGNAKSVPKTEESLKRWFPDPDCWGDLHVRIILFGREYCPARKHDMDQCPICSFAATDEAWQANRLNPLKFTAAKTHKNPYSIRDVPPVALKNNDPEDSDVDFEEPKTKRPSRRRSRGKTKLADEDEQPARKTVRRASKASATEAKREKQELETTGDTRKPKAKKRAVPKREDVSEVDGQTNGAIRKSSRLRKNKEA